MSPPRIIVRTAEILSGRWCFDGTSISVAEMRRDHAAGYTDSSVPYHFQGLSPEEIAAALAFEFPKIRETAMMVQFGSVTVQCECGEDTHQTFSACNDAEVDCQCGRSWLISTKIEPLHRTASVVDLRRNA